MAKSLSSWRTSASVSALSRDDFPAFVYPTRAATGSPFPFLPFRRRSRCRLTSESSALRCVIRLRIRRRSVSSFFSPGPLVPIPPPSLERDRPSPVSMVIRCCSCASSTCRRPSWVEALAAKMSRIRSVRSITFSSISLDKFRICAGDSSSSQMIPVASVSQASSVISASLPLPT